MAPTDRTAADATEAGGRRAARTVLLAALLAAAIVAAFLLVGSPTRERNALDGDAGFWSTRAPAELGMDAAGLREFGRSLGRGSKGCVVRDARIVHRWGSPWAMVLGPGRFRGWASATKPYLSILALFAVREGRIPDLDTPVDRFGWELRDRDRGITIRHLLDMTSGYGLPEGPGEAYAYNDYAVMLLFRTLLEGVYGTDGSDVAAETLLGHPDRLGPIGDGGGVWRTRSGAPRLNTGPCDFARFGQVLMDGGRWNGRQILPRSLLDHFLRPAVPSGLPRTRADAVDDYLGIGTVGGGYDQTALGPGAYGAHWWFNVDGRLWPDVPHDAFQANGHWNRHALTVIPSRRLVVAWREAGPIADHPDWFHNRMNDALSRLLATISAPQPPVPPER